PIRKSFALWTPPIPLNPRSVRAFWTLSPSGSVTPFRKWTSTRTRTMGLTAAGIRSGHLGLSRSRPDMWPEEAQPRGGSEHRVARLDLRLEESLRRKRSHCGQDRPPRESRRHHHGNQVVVGMLRRSRWAM